MMHHTKILKRCLTQPRLLLRTFLLGMLLTGCFAVMAGIGVSMASAQSLTGQDKPHHKQTHGKPKKHEEATPEATVTPAPTGKVAPVNNNQNTGAANNAAGSNNTAGAPGVGGVPVGGVPVAPGGVGGGRPGLPFTGSDPGNNPLP